MSYTVNEGPAPFKNGDRNITFISDQDSADLILSESETTIRNRLIDVQKYTIQNRQPVTQPPNVVNTTIVNNIVQVSGGTSFKATYVHAGTQNNIANRTKLINNGNGVGTFDENSTPIWNKVTNEIISTTVGEIIELQIRFRTQTDTLGGAFEIELNKGGASPIADIQEYDQTNQFQDYTIIFKVLSDSDFVSNNACIYIRPELGMTLTISNLSFLILK